MSGNSPEELIEALLPAVEQQLHSTETGYVGKCLRRLCENQRIEEDEAREMIAYCLAVVTDDMMKSGKDFNHKSYRRYLDKLPELPEA